MGIKYIITIDTELLAFAKEDAERKQISVSDLITQLLEEHERKTEEVSGQIYPGWNLLINQRDFKCEIWKDGEDFVNGNMR